MDPPSHGTARTIGDGCVLVGSTSNPAMYAQEWLANVPFAFRVDGGQELRAAVATLAARLAAAVAGRPGDARLHPGSQRRVRRVQPPRPRGPHESAHVSVMR
jgi:hypothetical protein